MTSFEQLLQQLLHAVYAHAILLRDTWAYMQNFW